MQFIKKLTMVCLLGMPSLQAMNGTEVSETQLTNHAPFTVTHSTHDVIITSVTESDRERITSIIQASNEHQLGINPEKEKTPYTLSSANFYVGKAKERSEATGFYALIGEAHDVFFAQGCMPTIYQKVEHNCINHFFANHGLTRKKNPAQSYDAMNMESVDDGGVVAVAFGADPSLERDTVKSYWKAFINTVKILKTADHKLTYAAEGQRSPKLLAFIAPAYDSVLLSVIQEVGFTVYGRTHETYGPVVHELYPELDRVLAVCKI
ncbi:MAG: hypothetical protein K2X98_03070 [Alphaproteobacteria bacterium]|nr:hypothetical protein [Alphaproteobacteria bacterium]